MRYSRKDGRYKTPICRAALLAARKAPYLKAAHFHICRGSGRGLVPSFSLSFSTKPFPRRRVCGHSTSGWKRWDFARKEAPENRKVVESHYREWSKSIGADNSIKTLAEYYDVKYNDSPRYELLQRYARDVDSGWISPLSRFDNYEALYNQVQTEIVGTTASNGVVITGQSLYFMQRVIGTMVDPQKLRDNLRIIRRSGVDIEEIKAAIFSPERVDLPVSRQDGMRSIRFIGETCAVTVNPDTGMLIQTNRIPEKRKQDA